MPGTGLTHTLTASRPMSPMAKIIVYGIVDNVMLRLVYRTLYDSIQITWLDVFQHGVDKVIITIVFL